METYLSVSHISPHDDITRGRLAVLGITHWSFFRSTTEEILVKLGFPLGIARLLQEGIGRLNRYHNVERGQYEGGMTPHN